MYTNLHISKTNHIVISVAECYKISVALNSSHQTTKILKKFILMCLTIGTMPRKTVTYQPTLTSLTSQPHKDI